MPLSRMYMKLMFLQYGHINMFLCICWRKMLHSKIKSISPEKLMVNCFVKW